jgi:hypothetical protein
VYKKYIFVKDRFIKDSKKQMRTRHMERMGQMVQMGRKGLKGQMGQMERMGQMGRMERKKKLPLKRHKKGPAYGIRQGLNVKI